MRSAWYREWDDRDCRTDPNEPPWAVPGRGGSVVRAAAGRESSDTAVRRVPGAVRRLGLTYFGAQAEINHLAPGGRRGEVTAAFLTCVYLGVAATAISTGLLSDAYSLPTAIAIVSAVAGATALVAVVWQLKRR